MFKLSTSQDFESWAGVAAKLTVLITKDALCDAVYEMHIGAKDRKEVIYIALHYIKAHKPHGAQHLDNYDLV